MNVSPTAEISSVLEQLLKNPRSHQGQRLSEVCISAQCHYLSLLVFVMVYLVFGMVDV